MLSVIYFALAAPVAVQKPEVCVSGVDDVTTTSPLRHPSDMRSANAADLGPWLEQDKRQYDPTDSNDSPEPSNPAPWDLNLPSPTSHPLSQSSTHGDIDLNSSPSQFQGATDDSLALIPLSPNDHMNSNSPPPPNSGSTVDVLAQAHPDPLPPSSVQDYINSLFYDSPNSEQAPGSPHDAPTQANTDPLAASSSAHGVIYSPSTSSLNSESTSGLAHDTPPQSDPDSLASPTAREKYIYSLFHYSPSSESTPGSPYDAPTQADPDPLAASSSAHGVIHLPSSSSLSSESTSGLEHDTQAHPDSVAGSPAQNIIDLAPPFSTSSESAPGSPLDTPLQAHQDMVGGSSAQNPIDLDSSSSESTLGAALDTHPQAHSDPLTPSSAHGITYSDLPRPAPPSDPGPSIAPHPLLSAQSPDEDSAMADLEGLLNTPFLSTEKYHSLSLAPTDNYRPQASPSNPGLSTGLRPLPLVQPPGDDSSIVDFEHPPPAVLQNPGPPTGLHSMSSAQSPDEGSSSVVDLDTLLKIPFLSTEEYDPLSLWTTDNHLPASPSNPGSSTGPHPPPLAQSSVEDSSMVDFEHYPPAVPPDPGSSTGLHTLPNAQSPDGDLSMADLDTLLKTPFLSTEEYDPLDLGTTDSHHPPASLLNPGTSTGLHPLPSADSQNGDSGSADSENPLKSPPFLDENDQLSMGLRPGPTDKPPQASPPNPGLSTEPIPPPNAKRPRPEDHDWGFRLLSKILKGRVKRHFTDSGAVQSSLQDAFNSRAYVTAFSLPLLSQTTVVQTF